MTTRTLGAMRTGVGTNPHPHPSVETFKGLAAALIDAVNELDDRGDPEVRRLKALAMTDAESASHWATKAATRALV